MAGGWNEVIPWDDPFQPRPFCEILRKLFQARSLPRYHRWPAGLLVRMGLQTESQNRRNLLYSRDSFGGHCSDISQGEMDCSHLSERKMQTDEQCSWRWGFLLASHSTDFHISSCQHGDPLTLLGQRKVLIHHRKWLSTWFILIYLCSAQMLCSLPCFESGQPNILASQSSFGSHWDEAAMVGPAGPNSKSVIY